MCIILSSSCVVGSSRLTVQTALWLNVRKAGIKPDYPTEPPCLQYFCADTQVAEL
ncbi:hypothetical protein [Neisseria dumasiana]|uniref:hypothetical protein n=1 Tax=Neisseria dumasiana TaxID=1931275 RepID=UPI0015D7D20B|nr:hypothetical protein [Neisseria dumasiana]